MRRIYTAVCAVLATMILSMGLVAASPSTASAAGGYIPEYYQFCYNNPPFRYAPGYTAYYKTAIARSSGVECQHYTAYNGWFFGWPWRTYYNWDTVCRAMRLPTPGWWDGRYPRCGR